MKQWGLAGLAILLGAAPAAGLLGAAPAAAQTPDGCTAYKAQADAMAPDVTRVFALMNAHDLANAAKMLPALEARLAQIPAAVPTPVTCGAATRVFDHHRYLRFVALQKAGKPVPGFPASAKFVDVTLPFAALAYAVGWLRYEGGDLTGARGAYAKGLAIDPGNHDLTNELAAALLHQGLNAEALALLNKFLAEDNDAPPDERAKLLVGKAVAQYALGDKPGARGTVASALALDPNNSQAKSLAGQFN